MDNLYLYNSCYNIISIFAQEYNAIQTNNNMRLRMLLFMLIGMALLGSNANGANYRAVYDFEYTKDSIRSIKGKDILNLELCDGHSFCFSQYTWETDSLHATPGGDAVWRKLFTAALEKEGSTTTAFPHKRSTFLITKHYTSDTLHVKDVIDGEIYEYDTFKSEFCWQLCDSTKRIKGFEAYMATCHYHGREWTVWFTTDIPFSDGPWMFCGLPGLILEAYDKDHLFSFRLMGWMSNPNPRKDWLGKGKKTDRISFLRKDYQYLKNLPRISNAIIGTNAPTEEDTRYLDGLEPDFK